MTSLILMSLTEQADRARLAAIPLENHELANVSTLAATQKIRFVQPFNPINPYNPYHPYQKTLGLPCIEKGLF